MIEAGKEYRFGQKKFKMLMRDRYMDENFNNREKFKETMIKKYGVPYVPKMKNVLGNKNFNSVKDKLSIILKKLNLTLLDNYIGKRKISNEGKIYQLQYNMKCNICGTKFMTSLYNEPNCPICNPKHRSNIQQELYNFLSNVYNGRIVENDRTQILPLELDFYLPDKKFAIELDGIICHSENFGSKSRSYHLNKSTECEKKNIKLLHIFENEWINKQNIVKSIIKSNLGIYDKVIYAKDCKIKEISDEQKNIFLGENHLQGKDISKIKLGLFNDNKLISVMTFSKSRFNKNVEYEMTRFANKLDTKVVGGASKLFKHFIKVYNPVSIISYSDKRYFTGEIYKNLGFNYIEDTSPNYFYFDLKSPLQLLNRMQFQKHKLSNILKEYNSELAARLKTDNSRIIVTFN